MSIVSQGTKVGGGEDQAVIIVPYPSLQATATLTINRDQPDVSNHHEWAVCSGELVLVSDVDPEVRVSKQLEEEWNIESYVVDFARAAARAGDLDDVFAQFVGANERQFEIQNELRVHGFRMAHSMAVLDGDAHPVMVIATGEMAEDDELTPEVIALASEWSLLESPELAEEHGLDFPPAKAGESGGVQYMGVAQSVKMRPDGPAVPAFQPPAPMVADEWLGGPDELDVTTDASTLLRAALTYATMPEKVNVDWLCASLQAAVAKLDKAPAVHDAHGVALEKPDDANAEAEESLDMLQRGPDTPGFLLAFPEGTKAEAEEIVNMLRHGGNTVVVVEPSLAGPVLDAVDWHMAMAQDDLDPFAQG